MIDMHAICRDLEQAKEECQRLHRKVHQHASGFSWDLRSTYTVDESFWTADNTWVRDLANREKGPSLLKKADPKKQRPINIEYHINGTDGALEIAAIQIDCCNPDRFGLRLDNGKAPVALHLSIVGSIERCLYALVLNARNPSVGIPPWLAPEQVRFLTSDSESEVWACHTASRFQMAGLRATIDDRDLPFDEKRARAAQAFVPYILEEAGAQKSDEVLHKLVAETQSQPQHPASFPLNLSNWPKGFRV
jgi:threonyl-tRNA synthetase